jgi:hypothetical protein
MADTNYMQAAVDLHLSEYGVHANGHQIHSCGAHTGHTVQVMALAISPEVANYITRACNGHHAMFAAIKKSAEQFRFYETQHRAKTKPGGQFDLPGKAHDDTLVKAEANAALAAELEALIARITGDAP